MKDKIYLVTEAEPVVVWITWSEMKIKRLRGMNDPRPILVTFFLGPSIVIIVVDITNLLYDLLSPETSHNAEKSN